MKISLEYPLYDMLAQLKENNMDIRFNYYNNKGSSCLGKIKDLTKRDILLLPYLVWENIPTPKQDIFLNRCRIERNIPKPIPLTSLEPEPLSPKYIDYFVRWVNYFSSKKIDDLSLRKRLFDGQIYPLPDKEDIELFEKSLIKKNII